MFRQPDIFKLPPFSPGFRDRRNITFLRKIYSFIAPYPAYLVRAIASQAAAAFRKAPLITRAFPIQLIEVWSMRPYKIGQVIANPLNATGAFSKASTIAIVTQDTTRLWQVKRQPSFAALLAQNGHISALTRLLGGLHEETLLIGGTDSTFPTQTDLRYPTRSPEEVVALENTSMKKQAVYVENLTSNHRIFSPVPGGVLPHPWKGSVRLVRKNPLSKRGDKLAFCAHRTRTTSGQWETRRLVTKMSRGPWSDFVDIPSARLDLKTFRRELSRHFFTICVEGGGLDPSPKAFEALLNGSIPIIRESPVADAYRHFPVVVVPEWREEVLCKEMLETELARLQREWDDWSLVLERLSASYWLGIMKGRLSTRQIPPR